MFRVIFNRVIMPIVLLVVKNIAMKKLNDYTGVNKRSVLSKYKITSGINDYFNSLSGLKDFPKNHKLTKILNRLFPDDETAKLFLKNNSMEEYVIGSLLEEIRAEYKVELDAEAVLNIKITLTEFFMCRFLRNNC